MSESHETASTPPVDAYEGIAPYVRIKQPSELWHLKLIDKQRLSQTVMRATFAGEDCAHRTETTTDERVVLCFDDPQAGGEALPVKDDERGWKFPDDRPHLTRHITIRRYHADGRIELDFILHDKGYKTNWILNAPIGLEMTMISPKGGGVISDDYDRYVFFVDEMGLPGMARWMEETESSAPIELFVRVPSAASKIPAPDNPNVHVTWLCADQGDPTLMEAVRAYPPIPDPEKEAVFVRLVGEFSEAQEFRAWAKENHPYPDKHATARSLWERGVVGH